MRAGGCLPFVTIGALLVLLPILFAQVMVAALEKLHLGPTAAVILVIAIIAGGLINIPVWRFERTDTVVVHPFTVFGLGGLWPELQRERRETVIAVNVGGGLVPAGIAAYEVFHLVQAGFEPLLAVVLAAAINVAVCYRIARPVPGVGIALPALLPPVIAALGAFLLAPEHSAPVAFVAGVSGPLIGADLLHLKEIKATETGMASIGGAGTFDGIVLSGIVAVLLA